MLCWVFCLDLLLDIASSAFPLLSGVCCEHLAPTHALSYPCNVSTPDQTHLFSNTTGSVSRFSARASCTTRTFRSARYVILITQPLDRRVLRLFLLLILSMVLLPDAVQDGHELAAHHGARTGTSLRALRLMVSSALWVVNGGMRWTEGCVVAACA
eukprot:588352-Rhodomonas_salina.1